MSLRCFSVSTTACSDISMACVLVFAPKTLCALLTSRSSSLNDVNAFAMIHLFRFCITEYQSCITPVKPTLSCVAPCGRATIPDISRSPLSSRSCCFELLFDFFNQAQVHDLCRRTSFAILEEKIEGESLRIAEACGSGLLILNFGCSNHDNHLAFINPT